MVRDDLGFIFVYIINMTRREEVDTRTKEGMSDGLRMQKKKKNINGYNSNKNYKQGNQREVRMVNHNNNKVDKIMKTLYYRSWSVSLSVSFSLG